MSRSPDGSAALLHCENRDFQRLDMQVVLCFYIACFLSYLLLIPEVRPRDRLMKVIYIDLPSDDSG
jgi:hypothetical protein